MMSTVTSMKNAMSISDLLPTEICLSFFDRLTLRDQLNLALTCRRFYRISEDKSLVELQTHRMFVCLVNKQPIPEKLSQAVRILKVPTQVNLPDTLQFLNTGLVQMTQLTTLIIKKSYKPEIVQILADPLKYMKRLQVLNLSSNSIGCDEVKVLAPALGQLHTLTVLNLSGNDLEDKGAAALATPLSHLTNLTTLDLSMNRIGGKGIKALVKPLRLMPHLHTFQFNHNDFMDCWDEDKAKREGIETLLKTLSRMKNFTRLGIASTSIGAVCIQIFTELLPQMKSLTHLDVESEGSEQLAEVFCQIPNLQVLNLSEWDTDDPEELLEACSRIPNLTKLILDGCKMPEANLERALSKMQNLRELNLNNCELDVDFIYHREGFARGLMQMVNLKKLSLLGCRINICEEVPLFKALSQLPQIEVVKIEMYVSKKTTMASLVTTLHQIYHIKNLELTFEKEFTVTNETMHAFVSALTQMCNLTKLRCYMDLQMNVEEAAILSGGLRQLTKLTKFSFVGSNIGSVYPGAIAESLRSMINLRELELRNNQIGEEEIEALAKVLTPMRSLEKLCLCNHIGDKGAQALATTLHSMVHLKELGLSDSQIGDVGALVLAKTLPSMIYLKKLSLYDNPHTKLGFEALEASCKRMFFLKYHEIRGRRQPPVTTFASSTPSNPQQKGIWQNLKRLFFR